MTEIHGEFIKNLKSQLPNGSQVLDDSCLEIDPDPDDNPPLRVRDFVTNFDDMDPSLVAAFDHVFSSTSKKNPQKPAVKIRNNFILSE